MAEGGPQAARGVQGWSGRVCLVAGLLVWLRLTRIGARLEESGYELLVNPTCNDDRQPRTSIKATCLILFYVLRRLTLGGRSSTRDVVVWGIRLSSSSAILAIDIGNSRIKFGVFPDALDTPAGVLPTCREVVAVSADLSSIPWEKLPSEFVKQHPQCIVASVNPPATERLLQEWPGLGWAEPIVIRDYHQLPILNQTSPPEQTGIDRLLKGVAGNVLRPAGRPLILVDSGTATTVDWITEAGAFAGGAILPGLSLTSHALHDYTAGLPLVPSETFEREVPEPLGKNTQEALRSGLYWGYVGAVRELIVRLSANSPGVEPTVLFTGGAGQLLAREMSLPANYHRDLTLQGLVLTVRHLYRGSDND